MLKWPTKFDKICSLKAEYTVWNTVSHNALDFTCHFHMTKKEQKQDKLCEFLNCYLTHLTILPDVKYIFKQNIIKQNNFFKWNTQYEAHCIK